MRRDIGKLTLGLIIIVILIGSLGGCESGQNSVPDIDVDEELVVDYDIIETPEEMHKRYEPHVVINEEATIEELEETAKQVAKDVAEDKEYRALNIIFSDYEEYADFGMLGVVRC